MVRCRLKTLSFGAVHPHLKYPTGTVNVYLLELGDKRILVDCGTPWAGPVLARTLQRANWTPDYLAITHAHIDHVGGAFAIQKAFPTVELLAHPDDVATIEVGQVIVPANIDPWTKIRPVINWAWTRRNMPTARVDGPLEVLEELGIELVATPGHSFPHHSLLLPNGDVIAGDALTVNPNGSPRLNVYYEDREEQIVSLMHLASRAERDVYPGHGPSCSVERVHLLATQAVQTLRRHAVARG